MPVLANPRHEKFSQELAKGKNATEAYASAGYEESRSAASRLSANVNIEARVAEIQSRAAVRAEISRADVLKELAAIAFAPIGTENVRTSDKRAALVDIAKIEGWVIDRAEVGKPNEFDCMTDDELREKVDEMVLGMGYVPAQSAKARKGLN